MADDIFWTLKGTGRGNIAQWSARKHGVTSLHQYFSTRGLSPLRQVVMIAVIRVILPPLFFPSTVFLWDSLKLSIGYFHSRARLEHANQINCCTFTVKVSVCIYCWIIFEYFSYYYLLILYTMFWFSLIWTEISKIRKKRWKKGWFSWGWQSLPMRILHSNTTEICRSMAMRIIIWEQRKLQRLL